MIGVIKGDTRSLDSGSCLFARAVAKLCLQVWGMSMRPYSRQDLPACTGVEACRIRVKLSEYPRNSNV